MKTVSTKVAKTHDRTAQLRERLEEQYREMANTYAELAQEAMRQGNRFDVMNLTKKEITCHNSVRKIQKGLMNI